MVILPTFFRIIKIYLLEIQDKKSRNEVFIIKNVEKIGASTPSEQETTWSFLMFNTQFWALHTVFEAAMCNIQDVAKWIALHQGARKYKKILCWKQVPCSTPNSTIT